MSQGPPRSQFTQSVLAVDNARKQRRTRMLAGLAGLLALVLCAGGWMLWAAADDSEAGDQGAKAVQQAPDAIRNTVETAPSSPVGHLAVDYQEKRFAQRFGRDASVRAPGTWATDKTLVRGVGGTLKGFAFGTSKEVWSTELGGPVCGTTRHVTADGRTAVLFQEPVKAPDDDKKKDGKKDGKKKDDEKDKKGSKKPKGKKDDDKNKKKGSKKDDKKKDRDKDKGKGKKDRADAPAPACTRLALVDLDTGKKLWQVTLPDAEDASPTSTNVTMTRGTVTVAWSRGSVAYDMKGGERLWQDTRPSVCGNAGLAGGNVLLVLRECGAGADRTYRVQRLDPRTGKALWTYGVASGVQRVHLVSSEPAVVAVAVRGTGVDKLLALDDLGAYRSTVDMPEGRYIDDCFTARFGTVETCDAIVAERDRLFLATKPKDPEVNRIVSFDLATGKVVRKFESRGRGAMYPLELSGGRLLAFRGSADGVAPDAVVSLDPESGRETPFLLFSVPEGAGPVKPGETDVLVEGGRVFIAPKELRAEPGERAEGAAYGALGVEGA
ncbi:PQQ-binding-like beta-propeller repeat protein [Streptomyces spectabilis]|uniref:outer membrane protein assembly factor BamB family protein n=1 Tax=Streptomyces spectabilis TaxID=68270 RepID=UPI0033D1A80D